MMLLLYYGEKNKKQRKKAASRVGCPQRRWDTDDLCLIINCIACVPKHHVINEHARPRSMKNYSIDHVMLRNASYAIELCN